MKRKKKSSGLATAAGVVAGLGAGIYGASFISQHVGTAGEGMRKHLNRTAALALGASFVAYFLEKRKKSLTGPVRGFQYGAATAGAIFLIRAADPTSNVQA